MNNPACAHPDTHDRRSRVSRREPAQRWTRVLVVAAMAATATTGCGTSRHLATDYATGRAMEPDNARRGDERFVAMDETCTQWSVHPTHVTDRQRIDDEWMGLEYDTDTRQLMLRTGGAMLGLGGLAGAVGAARSANCDDPTSSSSCGGRIPFLAGSLTALVGITVLALGASRPEPLERVVPGRAVPCAFD